MKLFAIKDDVAGTFGNVMAAPEVGLVRRSLVNAVNDPNPKNMWHTNPEDFSLYQIAEFDEQTGESTSKLQYEFRFSDLIKHDGTN